MEAGGFDALEVTEAGLREGVFFAELLGERAAAARRRARGVGAQPRRPVPGRHGAHRARRPARARDLGRAGRSRRASRRRGARAAVGRRDAARRRHGGRLRRPPQALALPDPQRRPAGLLAARDRADRPDRRATTARATPALGEFAPLARDGDEELLARCSAVLRVAEQLERSRDQASTARASWSTTAASSCGWSARATRRSAAGPRAAPGRRCSSARSASELEVSGEAAELGHATGRPGCSSRSARRPRRSRPPPPRCGRRRRPRRRRSRASCRWRRSRRRRRSGRRSVALVPADALDVEPVHVHLGAGAAPGAASCRAAPWRGRRPACSWPMRRCSRRPRVPANLRAAVALPPGILARGPWQADQVATRWREDRFEPGSELDRARRRGDRRAAGPRLALARRPGRAARRVRVRRPRPDDRAAADALVAAAARRGRARLALGAVRGPLPRRPLARGPPRADWVATWAGRWALGAGGAVEVGEDPVDGARARARGGVVGRARSG